MGSQESDFLVPVEAELHFLEATKHAPNSTRPVVVYRDAIRSPTEHKKLQAYIEKNHWRPEGFFGPFYVKHYHATSHECYCFVKGTTTFLLGVGEGDDESKGLKIDFKAGDVMIMPAGTCHASFDASDDLQYLASYPEESAKWDVNRGWEDDEKRISLFKTAYGVPIPQADPLYGSSGPLILIWAAIKPGSV